MVTVGRAAVVVTMAKASPGEGSNDSDGVTVTKALPGDTYGKDRS